MAVLKNQSAQQAQPTDEQWRDLYAAANALRKSACWIWMEDGDIFAVQDPVSRQNYYCSVMGGGGMEFGVGAYRGHNGFRGLQQLLMIEDESENAALSEDFMFIQDALSCTFNDREALDKKDLAVIRRLGLKYRGRGEWPLFRDYTPGLVPWFLTGPQCVTLTHILGQAVAVALECKKSGMADILFGPKDELTLRVARKTASGLEWSSRFMNEQDARVESLTIELSDQLLVQKLKKLPVQKRKSWDLDRFYLPAPIHDRERPYYPEMVAIVDHETGMALSTEILPPGTPAEMAADELIDMLLKSAAKPRRILVKQESLAILLEEFCEQIGLELRMTDRLPRISELRQGFLEFSRR